MNISLDTIKPFLRDRLMVGLTVGLFLVGIGYVIYIAFALEPSDLQVATRYTAFGDTHFYRSKWYYLLSFIIFGVILMGAHTALSIKLFNRGHRSLAIALLGITAFLFVVSWLIAGSVLRIAFL